jgi:hypothetical protein
MGLGGVSTHHGQIVSATINYRMDVIQKRVRHKPEMAPAVDNRTARELTEFAGSGSKRTRIRIDLISPDGTVIQSNAPVDQVAAKVNAITGA